MSLSLAAASWGVATRVFGDISLNYIGQQVTKAFLQLPPEHAMSSLGKKLLGSLVSSVDEPVMLNLMRTLNPDRKIQRVVWFCLSKACVSAVKAEHDASHRLQLIALPIRYACPTSFYWYNALIFDQRMAARRHRSRCVA